MDRYSATIQFIPEGERPGVYHLWVCMTLWRDNQAVQSIPVFDKQITGLVEGSVNLHPMFAFLLEAADMGYGEVSAEYSKRTRSISGANARPGDTSVPS